MSSRAVAVALVARLAGLCAPAMAVGALAQTPPPTGPLRVPAAIVLYLHPEVVDRRFVEPLTCALERVLTAPVSVEDLPLALGPELNVTPTQLDVEKVADRFRRATAVDRDERRFRHLIVGRDLTVKGYNYLFAQTFGTEGETSPLQVLSTARLVPPNSERDPGAVAVTAQRIYKIVLRSIVHNSGHVTMAGCVMAFPLSLAEHDRKPSHVCAADRARLVRQGVLREREVDACQAIVSRGVRTSIAELDPDRADRRR